MRPNGAEVRFGNCRCLRLVHNFCDRECDSRFTHKRLLLTHAELASVGVAPPQTGARAHACAAAAL